jgi:transposase
MAYNFLRGDPDQPFLLPPDLRDWLPEDHLAWFILDVVDQLDLAPFLAAYRDDGHGHPAYGPKLLLGVLLYGYAIGVRSSRQIERRCQEDVAFRVLAANQVPDHVTIARFRVRHGQALAGFLVQSLRLCAAAGMVRVGTVALDGTKLAGNAAERANRTHEQLEAEKDGKPSESRSDGLRAAMKAKLASDEGKACYAKRKQTVEPVFGQIKDIRGTRRFMRRGLRACTAQWKLLCGTHNPLKLWRHHTARPLATPATT